MLANFEDMQKAARLQVEPLAKSTVEMMKGAQKITSEAADQVGKSVERFAVYYEKLVNAKGVDEALRLHSAFAAANVDQMFAGVTKMVETCAGAARDASAPVSEVAKEASSAVANIAARGESRGRAASAN
jgi:hypothetical protein